MWGPKETEEAGIRFQLTLKSVLYYYGPQAKPGPLNVFLNKVLWKHSLIHQFTHSLWLLSCYNCRVAERPQTPYGCKD